MGPGSFPLVFQSHDLSFSDWIAAFTLCLAPLIAHVVAGAPKPSYISETDPRWHDRVGLYNPISIMWRYYAIISRRMRAEQWDPLNMATANTVFWTSHGWDGSEYLAAHVQSRCYWRRLPKHGRPSLSSATHTVVVTLQGVQAFMASTWGLMVSAMMTWTGDEINHGLNTIFFPFAILGIARIFPALWLTDEYDFVMPARGASFSKTSSQQEELVLIPVKDHEQLTSDWANMRAEKHYRPPACWRDRIARLMLLVYVGSLCADLLLHFLKHWGAGWITASSFTEFVVDLMIVAPAFMILACYFVRGNSLGSTVIPCVNSLWYKLYSITVYVSMLLLVIIAAIETRKAPCGSFTTWPVLDGWFDVKICKSLVSLRPDVDGLPFGLATRHPEQEGFPNMSISGSELVVSSFVGSCQGHVIADQAQRVAPVHVS